MFNFLRQHPIASIFALVLHILIVYFAVYGFMHHQAKMQDVYAEISEADMVQADIVDHILSQATTVTSALKQPEPIEDVAALAQERLEQEKLEKERLEKEKLEQEKIKQAEQEKQEKQEQEQEQEQAALKKQEEQQRLDSERAVKEKAEQQRLENEKKAEAEAKKKAAAELARQQQEAKEKEEQRKREEEARKQTEQQKKAEAEAKKKAEEEAKRKEAEAKRKKELQEQARREEALRKAAQAEREAEARAANAAKVKQETATWISAIGAKVKRAWIRESSENAVCDVYMRQTRDGIVKEARVKSCQGNASDAYKRSVESAVRRASPLPVAPSDDVFKGEIIFVFKPQ